MKYYLFVLNIIFIGCSNYNTNMSNINSNIKIVNSWDLPTMPSDIVSSKDSKWTIYYSSKEYMQVNRSNAQVEKSIANEEMYKVEKSSNGYLIITYDATNRLNKTWATAELDLVSKEILPIEDATDIAYSAMNKQIYWLTQSRKIMQYDPVSKQSKAFLSNYSVSDFAISANGKFLVVQDTDSNLLVFDIEADKIVLEKKSVPEEYFRIAGVTDMGKMVLLHSTVARKNSSKNPDNTIVLQDKNHSEILLKGSFSWAKLLSNNLAIWDGEKVKIYDL